MDKSSEKIVEFTLIYNRYKSGVYYYVYKMLNDKMITEDIVQNVFLKFFENLDIIKDKNSIAAWLYTTARNEIYEALRRKKRKPEFFIDLGVMNSDTDIPLEYEFKELKRLIAAELALIPEDQREVYLLKEYSELSYRDIGDILGIDEGLVKSRLFKVRQKLIKRLSKLV